MGDVLWFCSGRLNIFRSNFDSPNSQKDAYQWTEQRVGWLEMWGPIYYFFNGIFGAQYFTPRYELIRSFFLNAHRNRVELHCDLHASGPLVALLAWVWDPIGWPDGEPPGQAWGEERDWSRSPVVSLPFCFRRWLIEVLRGSWVWASRIRRDRGTSCTWN